MLLFRCVGVPAFARLPEICIVCCYILVKYSRDCQIKYVTEYATKGSLWSWMKTRCKNSKKLWGYPCSLHITYTNGPRFNPWLRYFLAIISKHNNKIERIQEKFGSQVCLMIEPWMRSCSIETLLLHWTSDKYLSTRLCVASWNLFSRLLAERAKSKTHIESLWFCVPNLYLFVQIQQTRQTRPMLLALIGTARCS